MSKESCLTCGLAETCPKAKHFENYSLKGCATWKPVLRCKDCANFLGMGDWNLCCSNPPKEQVTWAGHLCYAEDPACKNFKEKINTVVDTSGDCGPAGMIANCQNCGASSADISWDPKKDACTCNKCGWTTGPNYKYLYQQLPEKVRVALRHYDSTDRFTKAFIIELIDNLVKETLE